LRKEEAASKPRRSGAVSFRFPICNLRAFLDRFSSLFLFDTHGTHNALTENDSIAAEALSKPQSSSTKEIKDAFF
jgi:hypothetical protein